MFNRVRFIMTLAAFLVGFSTGAATAADRATAIFAGGCFWCVEADFDKLDGVIDTVSGYTGGTTANPTYKSVTYGDTGHYEAVDVTYDPAVVDYRTLVDYFLRHVDPTDPGGQFCDRGQSYQTAVFVADGAQRSAAEAALAQADAALMGKVVTPILSAGPFTDAEDYHQNYYVKNPLRYRLYRAGCGRDARVDEVWKDAKHAS